MRVSRLSELLRVLTGQVVPGSPVLIPQVKQALGTYLYVEVQLTTCGLAKKLIVHQKQVEFAG